MWRAVLIHLHLPVRVRSSRACGEVLRPVFVEGGAQACACRSCVWRSCVWRVVLIVFTQLIMP